MATNAIRVIFPESIEFNYQDLPDDRELIANSLHLHPYEIQALCDELENNSDLFKGVTFKQSEERTHMFVRLQTKIGIEDRPLRLLSSSELDRLMMEIGIIAADKLSVVGPSLLIFDAKSWQINTDWLERYGECLGSPTCRFQTIAATHSSDIDFEKVKWSGWKVIELNGTPPNVTVSAGLGKGP